jgi:hypothetical protein
MKTKIISSVIRYTVTFAPDPENPAFGTSPVFVMARDVSMLDDIPRGIKHLSFWSVVVNRVQVGDQELTLESKSFNEEHYHVMWTELDAKRYEAQGHDVLVEVPSHLQNQVWVFEPKQRAEKRFAERARLSPEEAIMEESEEIAEQAWAMSDEEVADYLEKNGLGDLVNPESIDALLAKVMADPKQAARLVVVWDRDKNKSETEK